MRNLTKIVLMTVFTIGTITSSAYASGGSQARIAQENFEYFKAKGNTGTAQPVATNSDYRFLSSPSARIAQSNFDYFAKIGYKGGDVRPFNYLTDVSEYPFSGSVLNAERGGYVFSSAVKR